MKVFSHELKTTTTKMNGLWAYLGTEGIDFDDLQVTGKVEFTITPDESSYGWDGIKTNILDVDATVTWKVYRDDLQEKEIQALIKAGAEDMPGGFLEGIFKIQFTPEWKVYTNVEIQKNGAIYLQQIEFDLCEDKSEITLSIR